MLLAVSIVKMQQSILLDVHVGPYWQPCTADSCCIFCWSTVLMDVFYSSTLSWAYCWRPLRSTKVVV